MDFKTKHGLIIDKATAIEAEYQKVMRCPHCGILMDAVPVKFSRLPYERDKEAVTVAFQCVDCENIFLTIYTTDRGRARFAGIVPVCKDDKLHDGLVKISPDFARIHRQSYRAEMRGDSWLAIIGYRTAMEILIKDYAIKVDGAAPEEIKKLSLYSAIGRYMKDELFISADVVRLVGNSNVHFNNELADISFDEFKYYYSIFLTQMGVHYDCKYPPVIRKR